MTPSRFPFILCSLAIVTGLHFWTSQPARESNIKPAPEGRVKPIADADEGFEFTPAFPEES